MATSKKTAAKKKPAPKPAKAKIAPKAKPAQKPASKPAVKAIVKPAAKTPVKQIKTPQQDVDLNRLLMKSVEAGEDPASVFHKAAQLLKKNVGFTSLAILHGSEKHPTLVALHENDASHLVENGQDLKVNVAWQNDQTEKGSYRTYRMSDGGPQQANITGALLAASIPVHYSKLVSTIVIISEDPTPAYTKADFNTIKEFAHTFVPLIAAFDLAEEKRKNSEASSRLRDELQNAQKELSTIIHDEERKRATLETELKSIKHTSQELSSNLENEKKQTSNLKSALEEEKARLKAMGEELEFAKMETEDQLKEARAPLQKRISELEKEMADAIQNESRSASEKVSAIQSNLTTAQKEKSEIQNRLNAAESELANSAKSREELNARIAELEQSNKDREQNSRKESEDLKSEISRITAEKNKIASDLDAIQKNSSSASAQLKSKIDELGAQLQAEVEKHSKELSFQEARNRELNSHLEDEKKKFAAAESKSTGEVSSLQKQIEEIQKARDSARSEHELNVKRIHAEHQTELEKSQRELSQQLTALKAELEKKHSDIAALRQSLDSQSAELAKEKENVSSANKLAEQARQNADAFQTQAKNLTDKATRVSEQLEQARKETYKAQEERTETVKQVKSLEELLVTRDRELKQKIADIQNRDQEISKQKSAIESAKKDIQNLETVQAELRKELGHYREREYRLEQDILALEEEKRGLNSKIETQNAEIAKLTGNLQKTNSEKDAVTAELAAVRAREKKLGEELQSAISKEKGSREEGIILSNFAHALSAVPGFAAKLDALRSGLGARMDLKRVFAYSVSGDRLQLVAGALTNGWLKNISGKSFDLKQTTAGTALATLKADVRKSNVPEIPEESLVQILGAKLEEKSVAILPLSDSNETVGLLAIGSDQAIPEAEVRLLSSIAPLIAVSLRQEMESQKRNSVSDTIDRKTSIIRYLESRLHNLGFEINPDRSAEEILASFEAWIRGQARDLEENKIATELKIDSGCLLALTDLIHDPLHLYYITHEAITNTREHAEADRLQIILEKNDRNIVLSIEDNGEGLLRKAGSENPEKGHGLRAIRNMALDSGARCSMSKGADGRGLRIECVWNSGPG